MVCMYVHTYAFNNNRTYTSILTINKNNNKCITNTKYYIDCIVGLLNAKWLIGLNVIRFWKTRFHE